MVDVLELDELLELDADELVEAALELVDEVVVDPVVVDPVVVVDVEPLGLHALSWIVPPLNAKVEHTSLPGQA